MQPLLNAIRRYVLADSKLHADDTPVPVLAPGNGKANTTSPLELCRADRVYLKPRRFPAVCCHHQSILRRAQDGSDFTLTLGVVSDSQLFMIRDVAALMLRTIRKMHSTYAIAACGVKKRATLAWTPPGTPA